VSARKKQHNAQKASKNGDHHLLLPFCTETSQKLVLAESFLNIWHPYHVFLTDEKKALT
jgi:hypothetical protein